MMFRDSVEKFMLSFLDGVVSLPGLEVVQVPGGVPGRVHLVGRVERGEVYLKLVVILPVELHLLKSVTPENLTRQIGCPAQIELQCISKDGFDNLQWTLKYIEYFVS